jgi:group I intron endonuclease
MDIDKKWCVYMHIFPNNKSYIGITGQEPQKRWGKNGRRYLTTNKNGDYNQPLIANAIKKYCKNPGDWERVVQHHILFDGINKDTACHIEELLIELFQLRDKHFGYNISKGGEAIMDGRKHNEETKKRYSEQNKGSKHWNFGKHWDDETKRKISETQKKNGKNKGENNPRYRKGLFGEKNPMFGKKLSDETKQKIREKRLRDDDPHKKPVICIENGIVYTCAVEVEEKTGISRTSVSACCRHDKHRKTAGGYHWMLYSEYIEQREDIVC